MKFQYNDGGRSLTGERNNVGDCVSRSIAIATGIPYEIVRRDMNIGMRTQRRSKHGGPESSGARYGVSTQRKWFKDYMKSIGWKWTPTMGIGTGCKVHMREDELPSGRLVVALSKHMTAVIDGVIHDTHDPSRDGTRCVYGYWSKPD